MVKSRPEVSPHYRIPVGVAEKPRFGDPGKGKRRRMAGPGFFYSPPEASQVSQLPQLILGSAEPQLEESSRSPLFKRGTVLYAAVYRNERPVLPFNEVQADDLAKEVLDFDQNLQISERSMGIGKNGREVIKIIGKSSYGAFVEVLLHKKDGDGNDIMEKRFVRLQDRALAKNNSKLRFKRANQ